MQQQQPERAHSRVHFSPTPSRLDPPSDDSSSSDSDSSNSDDEAGDAGCSGAAGGGEGARGRPTPPLGFDVPTGFTFTGDLEEDLERLEALEAGEVRGIAGGASAAA